MMANRHYKRPWESNSSKPSLRGENLVEEREPLLTSADLLPPQTEQPVRRAILEEEESKEEEKIVDPVLPDRPRHRALDIPT